MLKIIEKDGDITQSKSNFICHCVNCQGKMGSGLAGGNWNIVKEIIIQTLITYNLKQNITLEIWKKE